MSFAEIALRDARSAPHATRDWFETLISTRPGRGRAQRPRAALAQLDGGGGITLRQSVRASIAADHRELHAAAELVRRRYAWRGYEDVCAAPSCTCEQQACDHRVILVAARESAVVGTLTVGLDAPEGLLVDETYRTEVDGLRAEGRRVCEITRFAIDAEADSKAVLTSLFGLAYLLTRALHNASDVLVEVNPRHVGFYRRLLGFCVASSERLCARVKAPAVLLRLEMEELERRLMAMGCFGAQASAA